MRIPEYGRSEEERNLQKRKVRMTNDERLNEEKIEYQKKARVECKVLYLRSNNTHSHIRGKSVYVQ